VQLNLACDVLAAEGLLGGKLIVGSAEDAEVLRVPAPPCARAAVIDLEERSGRTSFAGFVLERALLSVALEHLAERPPRDVAVPCVL
jgi:hypothetical protein